MKLAKEIFTKSIIDKYKLVPYGFIESNDGTFVYSKDILNGEFTLYVKVSNSGNIDCKLIEVAFNEEYKALDIDDYTGGFIGDLKQECEKVLQDIKNKCCHIEPFRFNQSNRITKQIFNKFGESPDYPFDDGKNDEDAVFRCKANQKWYGILMPIKRSCISKKKEDEDIIDVLNIKIDEEKREDILKLPSVYPAYHMNKQKWISIVLDGGLDDDTLMHLIDTSRSLVLGAHKPKRQGKTYWLVPANPGYYDLAKAIKEGNGITIWKQGRDEQVGDICYMYMAKPIAAIKYMCEVVETYIPYEFQNENVSMKYVMKIKLLKEFKENEYTLDWLREHGVKLIRGQVPINYLKDYIK